MPELLKKTRTNAPDFSLISDYFLSIKRDNANKMVCKTMLQIAYKFKEDNISELSVLCFEKAE